MPAAIAWKTATELIEWAVRNRCKLILDSSGIGTTAHLAMEEVLLQHDVRYAQVPCKGTADQMLAGASGQMMAGVNSTGFAPWMERTQIRLLATLNADRNPRWPDTPTMCELAYAHALYTYPWGLAAPAATQAAVIHRLHDAFHKAMLSERHTGALAKYDQEQQHLSMRDYRQAVLNTVERERRLLTRMNLLAKPAP